MIGPQMDDPIPISALNHYGYCPRRCALIHVEQIFEENVYTMRGRSLHERVDQPIGEFQEGVRIERALPLWSVRLGLIGKADVVEFHGVTPLPVEYKSGRLREFDNDELQLCAQGICLEEMSSNRGQSNRNRGQLIGVRLLIGVIIGVRLLSLALLVFLAGFR